MRHTQLRTDSPAQWIDTFFRTPGACVLKPFQVDGSFEMFEPSVDDLGSAAGAEPLGRMLQGIRVLG